MTRLLAAAAATLALAAPQLHAEALTQASAEALAANLYQVVNQPATKDVAALLSAATTPDFKSYTSNDSFITADVAAKGIAGLGQVVPDLTWTIKEILVSGDRMIVRGEATGTPVADFFGVPPNGKSFRIMSLDIWTVRDGKAAEVYHLEDWAGALAQLSAK